MILFVHLKYVRLLNSVLFDIDIGFLKKFNSLVNLSILWRRVSEVHQLYLEPSFILRTYRFLRILFVINVHPGENLYTSRRPLY